MTGTCIKIKKVVVDYLKSGYSSLFARSNKEQSQWKCPKRVGFNGKCFNVFYFLFPFQFSLYSPPISRYICRRNTFLWIFFARLLWQMELQTSYIWQCKWTSLLIFTVSTCSTPFTCREPREINSLIHSLTHSLPLRASTQFPSDNSLKVFRCCRTIAIYFVSNWLGYEMCSSFGTVWKRAVLPTFRTDVSIYLRDSRSSHTGIFISSQDLIVFTHFYAECRQNVTPKLANLTWFHTLPLTL